MKLLSGSLTPSLVESTVRLGTWMPFVPVTGAIYHFTKVNVSEPTARRRTEKAGQAYVEVQTAQLAAIEREETKAGQGPELQQISVDGAMVPLVNKQWAEVKTLVIGTVGKPVLRKGEWEVHTEDLSYFSRMTDHETFGRLATVETHRRGTETAGKVVAVNDGAEWEQGFVDLHRPDAVRILDWGHSAEHVGKTGEAMFGADTPATKEWTDGELHLLKHKDPDFVLDDLRRLRDELAFGGGIGIDLGALKPIAANLEYLEKRREQIRYAEYQAAGYPIGSGAVESGNKLVVEARLKGSGMHWASQNVDPMVALRNVACNDRWEEAWPQISERLRQQSTDHARRRRVGRKSASSACVGTPTVEPLLVAAKAPSPSAVSPLPEAVYKPAVGGAPEKPKSGPWRPAPDHPWRRMPVGKARHQQPAPLIGAKL